MTVQPVLDKPDVQEALHAAEASLGDAMRHSMVWYQLALAAIRVLASGVDAIRQLAADLPSQTKE